MEIKSTDKTEHNHDHKMLHFVFSHSYIMFLFAVIFGMIFDVLFPSTVFSKVIYQYVGSGFILAGSVLVYLAQSTSLKIKNKKPEDKTEYDFEQGPYKYTRNPTYLGVFLMSFGLGLLISSLFSILFIVIAYILVKFLFLKKEEILLEKKYGQAYVNYKNKVKDLL